MLVAKEHGKVSILKDAVYTPPGWHKPYQYSTLDNITKMKTHPAEKKPGYISTNFYQHRMNEVRSASPEIEQRLLAIDERIHQLRKEYQQILDDEFLTFRLFEPSDLPLSKVKVFQSKAEAERQGKL
jgi:hypothetical protein